MREIIVSVTEVISYEVTINVPDDLGDRIATALGVVTFLPCDSLYDNDQDAVEDAMAKVLDVSDAWAHASVDEREWEIVDVVNSDN